MKLRTVLNELRCALLCMGREELLDEDVIVVPEYEKNVPPEAKLLRLCSLKSYLEEHVKADEGQVLLVHTQGELPEGFSCTPDAVVVSHPYSYGDFRATFLDLPASAAILEVRREKMFEAFLASYDLAQFARRSSEVLGNPVIITNADMRLLATAGDFPADAPDVQEVLSCGYVSESVNSDLETDGMIEAVRRAHHSLLSGASRFGRHWVTSIIYYHHLEMGRYDVMESDRSITGFDLELVDYASQLAGIMIDRLGAAGERVGFGSSVLEDLVAGGFANEPTMRAQLALTGLPLDVSYALMAVMGQRGAGKDYYARVGGIVARAFRDCLWCAREDCLVVLAPSAKTSAWATTTTLAPPAGSPETRSSRAPWITTTCAPSWPNPCATSPWRRGASPRRPTSPRPALPAWPVAWSTSGRTASPSWPAPRSAPTAWSACSTSAWWPWPTTTASTAPTTSRPPSCPFASPAAPPRRQAP